jgi:hypothetical protein
MAARNHSRGARPDARLGGNRPRTHPTAHPKTHCPATPARRGGTRPCVADPAVLLDIARSLLTVQWVIQTSAAAVEASAAEHFPDVAQVLRIHAAGPLHEQIARLRALAGRP